MKKVNKLQRIKKLFNTDLKKRFMITVSTVMSVFAVMAIVGAATTVGLNVTTGGNLTADGTMSVGTQDTLNATSTIYHGLEIGTRTGFLNGGLNIDPSGNVRTSGSYFGHNNVQISSNSAPTIIGGIKDATNLDFGEKVYVSGKYAYVVTFTDDSLRIIDISDPRAPAIVGGVKDSTNLNGIRDVYVSGKYAYVANQNDDSMRIIDVSTPTAPVIVGGGQESTNLDALRDLFVFG